ncbi:MAG: 3'(2'),5'-bisphosphate nucleotidase [Myxococcales bacterium]|nr:3'(2'),5'-bisphosphate nucleotidase [Myxococcales bacterium]
MSDRSADLRAAIDAVREASRACHAVQQRLVRPETLEKKDKSPVTVADFASQGIVCAKLADYQADDALVGEESADALREPDQAALLGVVAESVCAALRTEASHEQVLTWIDRGSAHAQGDRYWTLDPIDGTKGFLRGAQYAVALGLIERGEVVLGVLGCPNLPLDAGRGALFSGVRGEPAHVRSLWDADASAREVRVGDIGRASDARLCESVESAHSDQDQSSRIAGLLGIQGEPFRIDSQCKYAAVARNDASIYLRMPTRPDYREKIWDHAAGSVIVECAGGRVSDAEGRDLDFRHGRSLEENRGIVATCGSIHQEVLDAVRAARR